MLPPGVYLAMNGCVFDPARTQKNNAQHRFELVPKPTRPKRKKTKSKELS
jgi:hypothetical protein